MTNAATAAKDCTAIIVRRDGAVDWVTMNRPARLNALTQTMFIELHTYFRNLTQDNDCRVVMLRGAGTGFCAGLDIKEAVSGGDALRGADGVDTLEPRLFDLIPAMRECPQPIIGLINGAAAGGGFGIALACDVRIASQAAKLLTAFTNIGLSGCEMGVSFFLPRIVGMGIATELMYTSRTVDAERALRIGLVSEVVAADQLEEAGSRMAADMLRATPLGLRRTKEIFNLSLGLTDLKAVLKIEGDTQSKLARLYQAQLKSFVEKS
jgi:enoyl-CoA hydratase